MVERLTILQAGGPETIHNLDNLSKSYATQLIEVISNADKLVWVDYQGKNTECIIEVMQSIVNVHGLTLEDIAHAGQRSKHETYQTYDFITIRDVVIEYKEWSKKIHNNQVSIVFNDKYVFSFHTHESPSIDKVIERTKIAGCKASEKAGDFLTYSIIDSIVDGYFDAIDTLEDVADKADDVVSSINGEHNHNVLKDIHWLRRTAIALRKSVREPAICTRYMSMRVNDASIYNDKNWIIVRSYGQFIQWITKNGLPDNLNNQSKHNSLWDARVIRECYEKMKK